MSLIIFATQKKTAINSIARTNGKRRSGSGTYKGRLSRLFIFIFSNLTQIAIADFALQKGGRAPTCKAKAGRAQAKTTCGKEALFCTCVKIFFFWNGQKLYCNISAIRRCNFGASEWSTCEPVTRRGYDRSPLTKLFWSLRSMTFGAGLSQLCRCHVPTFKHMTVQE